MSKFDYFQQFDACFFFRTKLIAWIDSPCIKSFNKEKRIDQKFDDFQDVGRDRIEGNYWKNWNIQQFYFPRGEIELSQLYR